MHPSEANEHREIPCKEGSTRALESSSFLHTSLPTQLGSAHVLGVPKGQ